MISNLSAIREEELRLHRMIAKSKQAKLSRSTADAMRHRCCTITRTDMPCSCGKHFAIRAVTPDGEVVRDAVCPVVWWVKSANPTTFESEELWRSWMDSNPFPKEDLYL